MRQRLSVVNLGVADLERSRRFYIEGMGLPLIPESTERAFWIPMNRVWLGLFPRERLAAGARVDPEGSGFQGIVLSHNVPAKTEVDEVLQRAERAGGSIVRPAADSANGVGRTGYFADPDGYRWEVTYSPQWDYLTNPPED